MHSSRRLWQSQLSGKTRLATAVALIGTLMLVVGVAFAAAPPDWDPVTDALGSTTDCTGSDAQSDAASSSTGGVKCQEYDNDGSVWDLYETLNYISVASGVPETADIETVTYFSTDEWLFIQWNHVDAWNSVNAALTHKHYTEIDVDGDFQGDYYVGFQPKVDLCPSNDSSCTNNDTWTDAFTASLLDAEYVDSNNDIGGTNLTQSDKANGNGGDGYESDNKAEQDEIYVRPQNGELQLAIRWSYLGQNVAPGNFCVRVWSAQESTISKDKLYWHDQNTVSDLSSAKYDNVFWQCFPTESAISMNDFSTAGHGAVQNGVILLIAVVFTGGTLAIVRRRQSRL